MSEEKKPAARKSRVKPVQFEESAPAPEPVANDKPLLVREALVRDNTVARNSASVQAVQAELQARGHWEVTADPAGYWGRFTQEAAVKETGKESPVEAAEALGFTVAG